MIDYIIVGQGIAGTMLSWFLHNRGQKILVVDKYNPSSASNIASGITNPITGRKFVKTWLADELIPFAQNTYRQFETMFGEPLYHPLSIIKIFDSIKAQNDWSVRCNSPEYAAYLKNESIVCLDKQKVKNAFGGFEISGGSRLNVRRFLEHYRNFLSQSELLIEEKFSFDELTTTGENLFYGDIKARKIIFCEGANAIQNPYFKFLPFQLAKGECLILKIENFYTDRLINGEVFIMPTGNKDEYYVGSTHEWNYADELPSTTGKMELLGNLSAVLNGPFEIVGHYGAIRPTVKDRRPLIGFHPEHINVGVFNGMGTKGISLAPFFANHFVEHLVDGKPLMKEISIERV